MKINRYPDTGHLMLLLYVFLKPFGTHIVYSFCLLTLGPQVSRTPPLWPDSKCRHSDRRNPVTAPAVLMGNLCDSGLLHTRCVIRNTRLPGAPHPCTCNGRFVPVCPWVSCKVL